MPGVRVAQPKRVEQPLGLAIDTDEAPQDHLGDHVLASSMVVRLLGGKLLHPEQQISWVWLGTLLITDE